MKRFVCLVLVMFPVLTMGQTTPLEVRRGIAGAGSNIVLIKPLSIVNEPDLRRARKLQDDGKIEDALRAYLAVPGGERAAADLSLVHPGRALVVLEEMRKKGGSPAFRASLVSGDLHLAKGEKDKALQDYRLFIKAIEPEGSLKGWKEGVIPHTYCPVYRSDKLDVKGQLFSQISGSWGATHTRLDHWLINRLLALEAWTDVTTEFSRIQKLHDEYEGSPTSEALQFVLSHAIFLIKRDREDDALNLLKRHFLRIDVDAKHTKFAPANFGYTAPAITAAEFIRLGYGAFKNVQREDELIAALERSKNPLSNRVLAKIRVYQGDAGEALRLELAYLDQINLSPSIKSLRKGKILLDFHSYSKATEELETALKHFSKHKNKGELSSGSPEIVTLQSLEACYLAMGKTEMVLSTRLKMWEAMPKVCMDIQKVENTYQLAVNINKRDVFQAWAKHALTTDEYPLPAKANLSWYANDVATTIKLLSQCVADADWHHYVQIDQWVARFKAREGKNWERKFLESMIASKPNEAAYHYELIKLLGFEASDDLLIAFYENLIKEDYLSMVFKVPGYHPAKFESKYNASGDRNCAAAHRLMRLYVKQGQTEKLKDLGVLLAKLEGPFSSIDSYYREHNLAMSYFMTHVKRETLLELKPLLENKIWKESRKHLNWILAGGVHGDIQRAHADVISPASTVVSDREVLNLATNDQQVFVGYPWGVVVYDLQMKVVKSIPLGVAATRLAADQHTLWVGTPSGLKRIDLRTWKVKSMRCDQDVPAEQRKRTDYRYKIYNAVTGLALHGNILWIGNEKGIRKLNTETNELQIYTKQDLQPNSSYSWQWFHFEDDGSVWAYGRLQDVRRYDPQTDTWGVLPAPEGMSVKSIIGRYQGKLWAKVYVGPVLECRPAVIDTVTLGVEPIRISSHERHSVRHYRRDYCVIGTFNNELVFRSRDHLLFHNSKTKRLQLLPEKWDQTQLKDRVVIVNRWTNRVQIRHDGAISENLTIRVQTPAGQVLGGGSFYAEPRDDYQDAPNLDKVNERGKRLEGLKWPDAIDKMTHDAPRGLSGATVFDVLATEQGVWLCTDAGISLISKEGRVLANYDRSHGLPCNASTSVAEVHGKVYFACGLKGEQGALVVFDPKTGLFTTLTGIDGLASKSIGKVEGIDGKIRVSYSADRMNDATFRQYFSPTIYDPVKNQFSVRSKYEPVAKEKQSQGEAMPLLGGQILSHTKIADNTWVAGTRGVIILKHGQSLEALTPKVEEMKVVVRQSELQQLLTQARLIKKQGSLTYAQAIKHANPYAVADFLTNYRDKLTDNQLLEIAKRLDSRVPELRLAATKLLAKHPSPITADALKVLLQGGDYRLKIIAAPVVAEFSSELPIERLSKVLSSTKYENRKNITSALSRRGDKLDTAVIKLLLKYPPLINFYTVSDDDQFPELGSALTHKPEFIKLLLTADDTRAEAGTNRCFVYVVFKSAGKEILPTVHQELRSKNRIIRANAALACAALGDTSSIKPLFNALGLESGLSRGAIVWALGELKAKDAIPELVRLYKDLKMVNSSRYQPGTGMSNLGDHYANSLEKNDLSTLNEDGERDEFLELEKKEKKRASSREPLLSKAMIINAISKIGPDLAQPLCRTIASGDDGGQRIQAIQLLAQAGVAEQKENIRILNMLCSQEDRDFTDIAAAISLYQLGEREVAKKTFIRYLEKGKTRELKWMVNRSVKNVAVRLGIQTMLKQSGYSITF